MQIQRAFNGAIVHIKELDLSTTTNLEGLFFKEVPSGNYTLQCKFLGYVPLEKHCSSS